MIQLNDLIFYAVMIVLMIGVGVMGLKPSGVTLVVTQTHRNIILKDISWYFLTTGLDTNRRNHMLEDFKEYKVKEVNPAKYLRRIRVFGCDAVMHPSQNKNVKTCELKRYSFFKSVFI